MKIIQSKQDDLRRARSEGQSPAITSGIGKIITRVNTLEKRSETLLCSTCDDGWGDSDEGVKVSMSISNDGKARESKPNTTKSKSKLHKTCSKLSAISKSVVNAALSKGHSWKAGSISAKGSKCTSSAQIKCTVDRGVIYSWSVSLQLFH